MRLLFNTRHILPLIIFFGVLTIGLRLQDVWDVTTGGTLPSFRSAHAETASDAPVATTPNPADAKAADAKSSGGKTADDAAPEPSAPPSDDDDASPAERDVLKQLAARRDELDKRAHELDTREALVKVGEQRVDQKIKEMESLRLQLQTMVNQISSAQNTQLDNLVKIYETMKPADAAKIFDGLDMPVLLGVIQRMKPKSTAPVLAAMSPDKAKQVTVALTKQDQLPAVK